MHPRVTNSSFGNKEHDLWSEQYDYIPSGSSDSDIRSCTAWPPMTLG